MKKLLCGMLLFSFSLKASVAELERAMQESDLITVHRILRKTKITKAEQSRLLILANRMINHCEEKCKLNHKKRPFCCKPLPEMCAQVGTVLAPLSGIYFYAKGVKAKIQHIIRILSNACINAGIDFVARDNKLKEQLEEYETVNLWVFSDQPEESLQKIDANKLDEIREQLKNLPQEAANKFVILLEQELKQNRSIKAPILKFGGACLILTGPALWIYKVYSARKCTKELDKLYRNAVTIEQLLYSVEINQSDNE